MDPERAKLKALLWMERKIPVAGVRCELCTGMATDLHEPWINRHQAGGNEALLKAILTSKYNASTLCNDCNVNYAETQDGREKLRRNLINRYGRGAITKWMNSLPFDKESTRREFLQEVDALVNS